MTAQTRLLSIHPGMVAVIPRIAGGPSVLANLATRCGWCNTSKGAKAP